MYSCKDAAQFLQLPLPDNNFLRKEGEMPFLEKQEMYFFEIDILVDWIKKNQPERIHTKYLLVRNMVRGAYNYLSQLILVLK
jgi:hypothetical protein